MTFRHCPCSGETLGKLTQPAILTVLARGPLHGYCIVERVRDLALYGGRRPDPTGVYRVLRSMEGRGLVASSWDLSDAGPARRIYRLTARGAACLRQWTATLAAYGRAVEELLGLARGAARRRARGRRAQPAPARSPRRRAAARSGVGTRSGGGPHG